MPARRSPIEDLLPALRTIVHAARIGAFASLAGWPVLFGTALLYVFLLSMLSAFWDVVVSEHASDPSWNLPAAGFALYVGVTELIVLSVPAIHLRMEDDIRSGAVETHLLRPKSYLIIRIGESIGHMLVRLAVLGGVGLILLSLSSRAAPSIEVSAYIVVVGVLGGTIGILLFTLVGICAVWMRRVLPVFLFVQKTLFLLGGLVAPITLYPDWLENIATATPFAAELYLPAMLTIEPRANWFLWTVANQVLWLAALVLLTTVFWRRGLKTLLQRGM